MPWIGEDWYEEDKDEGSSPILELAMTLGVSAWMGIQEGKRLAAHRQEGLTAKEEALRHADTYPELGLATAQLFSNSGKSLVRVYGCRSHPEMLLLVCLTPGGGKLAQPENIRTWRVKEAPGPHPGLEATLRYRALEMLQTAETLQDRYGGRPFPAIEAYALENAIPDHTQDWTTYLASLQISVPSWPRTKRPSESERPLPKRRDRRKKDGNTWRNW